MRRTYALIGTGALSVLALGAVPVLAQQGDGPEAGGPVLTFGISSTLSATDNYDLRPGGGDSADLFDNRLSFGYRNRRPNDTLSLDLSGVLRAVEPPTSSNTFDNRNARLGYQRQGVNSTLNFGANYSFSSVEARDPFDRGRLSEDDPLFEEDPLDETDFTQDRGDQQEIGAQFRLETGLNDLLGVILTARYRDRGYENTTDPDLFDSETLSLSGTTRFTLSPITEARVVLNYRDYSAEDDSRTDRQTSSVNLGLTQALSQVDTLDLSLGFQRIETDETLSGLRRFDTEEGVIGRIGLTRELTRGTIGTTFNLDRSENGRTATLLFNRTLPLPRGAIALSLGATSDVSDTIRPVGSLDFTHEILRSTLTASIERQVTTSDRSNELRTTRASVGYDYEINSLSGIGVSANFAELARAGGGPQVNDTIRADLRATYRRDLTRDWQLSTGYEYRIRDEDSVGEATSNRVFLTLQRSFSVRP
ncbi:hypothetical protein ACROSR_13735 [Roseovarius tibetensis]|uniref:hypothetical protein n=1 Tax=Roseovarius tibetensis TaxID=2685897 RepID=UPI003D7F548A